jgi:hypothetical protein
LCTASYLVDCHDEGYDKIDDAKRSSYLSSQPLTAREKEGKGLSAVTGITAGEEYMMSVDRVQQRRT